MRKRELYRRLRTEYNIPLDDAILDRTQEKSGFQSLIGKEKQIQHKRTWLPAAALCCTAAIAVAVCVPAYLNMQGNHDIVGGVSSSAPEEKELVWRVDNSAGEMIYTISPSLQKELDEPENKDALFRVMVEWYVEIPDAYLFEG